MYYWGHKCHSCPYMIAFAPALYDKDGNLIGPASDDFPKHTLVVQDCPECHNPGTYEISSLTIVLGPVVLGFRSHPAFQESRPWKEERPNSE
jgi:hypothetical protein